MNNSSKGYRFGTPLSTKSTVDEIRARFDQDVERFSRLETGQQATLDAPVILEVVAQVAATHLRPGAAILDLGCGAGNFTLRVLNEVSPLECHLVDLSRPMLDRAESRLRGAGCATVISYQNDLRSARFSEGSFDCILAASVLHHLREEHEWLDVFRNMHRWLRRGGRLYVADLTMFDFSDVQEVMWARYARYLDQLGGPEYRQKLFEYVEREDSPRSLPFQFEVLRRAGFSHFDVLHRHGINACYFAVK